MSAFHTELIRGDVAFSILADSWDVIVANAMTSTPFQKLAYQRSWWQHLGPGQLLTIAIVDEARRPSAIGCFYLYEEVLYFNGCVEETDYLDLIAPASLAAEAWQAIFDCFDDQSFPPWQRLDLCNIADQSPSHAILEEIAQRRGYRLDSAIQDVCPTIALPNTFDDYLMELDKKQRHEIRRKSRKARAAQAELVQVGPHDDIYGAVEEFLRLLQLSTVEKEDWLNEGRRALFHEVAAAAHGDGSLQLLFLRCKGENAAALFNFDYNDRIWVYNSGMDIVEFGQLSPGVVLTADAIQLAIADGRREFDFLRGNETYKYRFGARDTHIYRLQIVRA